MYTNILLSTMLFLIGSLGVFLSRKNLILSIMSLELMLLSVNMNFVFFSVYTDTLLGQISTFFILVVGASESAIGLALITIYHKGYRFYYQMYLLPIYLCFFSFLLSIVFGKHLSSKGSILLNLLILLCSLLVSFFICYEVFFLHINCYINFFTWISLGFLDIYWSFLFDSLSSIMLIVILLVSFCANFYSVEYMLYEPHKIRFFSYLSLFKFTMLMLVTSNTLLQYLMVKIKN